MNQSEKEIESLRISSATVEKDASVESMSDVHLRRRMSDMHDDDVRH